MFFELFLKLGKELGGVEAFFNELTLNRTWNWPSFLILAHSSLPSVSGLLQAGL